ncbi:dipeptidase [Anaerolinea thermolimosa]|uniref:C69 family dipeptidase n=1 Tax=Anaerolinea thermolimosa TaxID=229919 RepID=UPI000782CEBE|nr:C69 family dipeptidase [Anaerolinea thermolimosa]GAP05743.1 dipeptidase [Anaerolinea thermolimosa]
MCDTFVVFPDATADGSLLFGKNSDRDPNEAHEVILVPRKNYLSGSQVRCTYMEIPQVEATHAVLLLKPFWIWGAEMGANEHGVVIGNEAVFTRGLIGKEPGLIGMDLLRLALERASTAEQALNTMIDLLEKYGQGGNCGFSHPLYYNNSFLIADPGKAFVLETAGRQWAVEEIHRGIRTISNALIIENRWDRASAGLVETAIRQGWCRSADTFNFARDYSDRIFTTFAAGRPRQCTTNRLLQSQQSRVGVAEALAVLRHHQEKPNGKWRPDASLVGADVCMHAGFGPVRISQSVGSLVAHLTPERFTFWVTGTSAPCTSLFKPVWFEGGIPWSGEPAPAGKYNPACLWWRHELVHRRLIHRNPASWEWLREEQTQLEGEFISMAGRAAPVASVKGEISERCFQLAEEAEGRWRERLEKEKRKAESRFYYQIAWRQWNREAGLPLENENL